jgi:hypothetical protein
MGDESQIERVARILETGGGFRRIAGGPIVGEPFRFDAVLASADPLTLVVVESKCTPGGEGIERLSQQLESFVWSLYSLSKRHMVSAVLLSDTPVPAEVANEMIRNLGGICRLYVLDRQMPDEEIKSRLLPVFKPTFTRMHLSKIQTRRAIESLIEDAPDSKKAHLRAILEMSEKANDAEEVSKRLLDEFQRLISEVEGALTKAEP